MPIDAVVKAFIELFSLVNGVVTTVAAFRSQLQDIESTLKDIEPIINDMDRLTTLLDHPKNMDRIKVLLDKGNRLVNNCSGISRLPLWKHLKQYTLSKKLTKFNAAIQSEFHVYPMRNARNILLTLLEMKELKTKVDTMDHNFQVFGRALQSNLGASERQKEREISVDLAAAPVETTFSELGRAFIELFSVVKKVGQTVAVFRPELKKIESTLSKIETIIEEWDEYIQLLGHSPKEMVPIKELFVEGKGLVEKCSRIKSRKLYKKYTYSKKLTEFDAEVLREFQIYIQPLNARNNNEILSEVKEMTIEDKKLIHSGQANSRALQRRLEPSGNLTVPNAPNFIVGSDVKASLRKLKEQLLKEGVSVNVVTGPRGCGKTTLLKKLCHDVHIEGKFNNIMFIPVSEKPNLTDIVQKMYHHNSCEVPEIETENAAVSSLKQLLMKIGQAPVLLVLDGVGTKSELFIMNFVCKDIKDYKIVVTSRGELSPFPNVHLNPLTHKEAVELFQRCVTSDDRSVDVADDKLLDQIVKLCKGLPLDLTVVANSLRGRDRSFWQRKLVEWSEGYSFYDSDIDTLDFPRKSSEDLDGGPWIKKLFMDLGSFPEDHMIPATALIDMWVELYKLDFDGKRAFNDLHKLVSRNLADLRVNRKDSSDDNESFNGHYIMQHELLRKLAASECNVGEIENRQRLVMELIGNHFPEWCSERKQQPLRARLVSISTDKEFSTPWPNLELPEAEALVLNFQTNEQTKIYALPEFIEKADKLKVLIVTNYSHFPAELHNFHVIGSNLRRIRLEHVTVSILSMGNLCLHSLRKLSFFMCDISQASTSNDTKISNAMPNLVELDIDHCNDVETLPDGICQIKTLRKLSITHCPDFSIIPEQIGQLKSLEVLRLNSSTKLSWLPDSIGQMFSLKKINIRGCLNLSVLPRTIVELKNLRKVFCEKEQDVLWAPVKNCLKDLELEIKV